MIWLLAAASAAHPYADEVSAVAPPGCEGGGARLLSLARAYTDERRQQDALAAISRARACGAEPAVVAAHEALVLAKLDSPVAALQALDEALQESPQHLGLRAERAKVLCALGMYEAALEDLAFVAARAPRPDPDLVLRHAEAWQRLGRLDEALVVLDEAIAAAGPAPALVLRAVDIELSLGSTLSALGRLEGLPDREPWRSQRAKILWMAGLGGVEW